MKILLPVFSPPHAEWGGLTRVIAFAEAAQDRGHSVAFCASGYVMDTLNESGWNVYALPATTLFGLPASLSKKIASRMQNSTPKSKPGKSFGSIWLLYAYSGIGRRSHLRKSLAEGLSVVHAFQPDVIVTDYDPTAYLLAKISGLPVATTFQGVYHDGVGTLSWKYLNCNTRHVLKEYKITTDPVQEIFFGPSVFKIVPSIPELEQIPNAGTDYCFVGSMLGRVKPLSASTYRPDPKQKHIYVYMGSNSIAIEQIISVMRDITSAYPQYTAVICSQSITDESIERNLVQTPYIPADNILPAAEWTICHGGQNTVIQSLSHGVPLMIFPTTNSERRFNAERVEAAVAGVLGESCDFTVDWIVSRMQQHSCYKAQATALGAKINGYQGATQAVEEIEKIILS